MHDLQELVRLHRLGTPVRDAARALGISPNTHLGYRKVFGEAGLLDGDPGDLPSLATLSDLVPQRVPRQQVSTAEPWRARVAALVERGISPRALHTRLTLDDPTFDVSYDAVKRLCRLLRKAQPVRPEDVVIRVETPAGEVAQVDFGYVGLVKDPVTGEPRRAWVFVMVLGYSRHLFARVVFDQTVRTWLDLHERAFAFLGGVPKTIVPDNLKAAVIRAAFGVDDDVEAQRDYRELARFYGFRIDPTPPRSPEKKGKVERGVDYVCRFLDTRDLTADIDAVNADLDRWNDDIAALRVHGTTGRVPGRVFVEEERAQLLALPATRYEVVTWRKTKVQRDTHVHFERRFYSVPWHLIGKEAWIRARPTEVEVLVDDVCVARHLRQGVGTWSTVPQHLPDYRADLAERSPTVWRERAAKLGEAVVGWVDDQLGGDPVSALRRIQAAVLFLEDLPEGRAQRVCLRAREFGISRVGGLKSIVQRGLDLAELPSVPPAPGVETNPRFARAIGELYLRHQEAHHEWQ
jgi:transposase